MNLMISCLKETAERFPEHPAVSDTRRTLTYRELWRKAQNFAAWLLANKFSYGTNILVEANADVSFAVTAIGLQLAGCVLVPAEKHISNAVVLRLGETMQAQLFIGEKTLEDISCISFADVLKLSEASSGTDAVWKIPKENDTAEILYTTGTTGTSKAVVLSHRAVWASADNSYSVDRLNADSVYLIASPLNHINALRKLYSCFLGGAHAVLLDGFLDLKKYYEIIETHRVNALLLPPAAVRYLLFVSRDKLHSLAGQIKLVHTNSAPMTESDKEMLHQCLSHTRLIFGYGATEAGSVCCAYDYAELPGMVNCVGKPAPHAKITVVDAEHREIQSCKDHPGFLAVSGDSVMEGYWDDPVRTAEVLQSNTLYTNDLGYVDENGFIFVLGRAGDIINCGGLKVAPTEVENVAMQYPGIRDCACFGVKDPIAGSAVKLYVVPADEKNFDCGIFRSFLQSRLENHQLPRYIECVEHIPKTSNGKLDRKRLSQDS